MWLLAFVLAFFLAANAASAFECAGVKLPSSIVICSDPELMRLADGRQQAFNEARWGKSGTDLLDPQHDKELWDDQRAWVRAYAAACGAPPDGPAPKLPVSPVLRECFRRAAEERIAFLRGYGEQARQAAARTSSSSGSPERIGPGFDCSKATQSLAFMICADADLSRTDLRFNQAYRALLQQLDEPGRRQLKQDDVQFLEGMQQTCGVPKSGGLTAETWRSRDCIKAAFEKERSVWLSRLSGPGYEEAVRSLDRHIMLERKLRQLALLTTPPVPEGIYGPLTRKAIAAWQQARGRVPTGLLGNEDALALEHDGTGGRVPPATEVVAKHEEAPPETRLALAPPSPPPKVAGTGTAFAINASGDFLTNYHVVKGCRKVRLRIGGVGEDALIAATDERNDLAIVRVPSSTIEPMRFRDGKGIRPADGVVALGFPYAGLLASSPQVTPGAVSALAGLEDDSRYLQFTAPVQPGSSGGPLVDLSGNVVGLITGRINELAVAEATGSLPQNINFAIKNGIVREFLDAQRIAYLTAASSAKVDPADVGEAATKSTVLVGCYK
jgi:S1-C subfamily serine protease/uncharacterized protein